MKFDVINILFFWGFPVVVGLLVLKPKEVNYEKNELDLGARFNTVPLAVISFVILILLQVLSDMRMWDIEKSPTIMSRGCQEILTWTVQVVLNATFALLIQFVIIWMISEATTILYSYLYDNCIIDCIKCKKENFFAYVPKKDRERIYQIREQRQVEAKLRKLKKATAARTKKGPTRKGELANFIIDPKLYKVNSSKKEN